MNTKKKNKVVKAVAVALAFCLTMGIAQRTVMASEYTPFPYVFNYASGMPSSDQHLTQTVEVVAGGTAYAYAKCTSYPSGCGVTLTVKSVSVAYPTKASVDLTSTAAKQMIYTVVPKEGKTVEFQGKVTAYSTGFTISAAVKG